MREVLSMNPGWKFHRGDIQERNFESIHNTRFAAPEWLKAGNHGLSYPGYPDDAWQTVDLPHDFVVEGSFSRDANRVHGSRVTDVGWYRKTFTLPDEDRDRRILVEFDGVYRDGEIWMNGHFVGRHLSGYTSFHFDVTDMCHFGRVNTIAVRADATQFELWSYEGGGIYRDVRLVKVDPVHVPWCGTFVHSRVEAYRATITAETKVRNDGYETVACRVRSWILDGGGGAVVAEPDSSTVDVKGADEATVAQEVGLDGVRLWDIDDPHLYRVVTALEVDGRETDRHETPFGVREFRFDPARGFALNGRYLKLKGVCEHQDHAGVGVAIPPALYAWRLERLREMGINAIRTSHNPPCPALLDACDRMGILVMDETRLAGSSPEILGQLEDLIRRDRNHPGVILWSLGNEEMRIHDTEEGIRQFRRMQQLAHRLDPTRPTTYAMNTLWHRHCDLYAEAGFRFDVFGANYDFTPDGVDETRYDSFHERHPDWPIVASETGGSASTRGLYEQEYYEGEPLHPNPAPMAIPEPIYVNPRRKGIVSAYGETLTPWGSTIEQTWRNCADRDFLAGTFLWTGFDYRGETYPFDWPAVITRYGLLDLCGFPKDSFHYYRAWWRENDPMVHLFPHWNWEGREGEIIDMWCYSNCAEVELLLNDTSLGRCVLERNGHLEWEVPYAPGRLEARGFDGQGDLLRTHVVETAGPAAAVRLTPGRNGLHGDGEDVLTVETAITDAEGRFVATADHEVVFEVSGPARILGVGNGNPTSHEPDKADRRRAFHGLCAVLLQSTGGGGEIILRASSPGLTPCACTLEADATPPRPAIYPAGSAADQAATSGPGNPVDGLL